MTAVLTAGEREELPQLEKGAHSCHRPRGTFPAAGANPVRGSEGRGAGGLGTHTPLPCCAPVVLLPHGLQERSAFAPAAGGKVLLA